MEPSILKVTSHFPKGQSLVWDFLLVLSLSHPCPPRNAAATPPAAIGGRTEIHDISEAVQQDPGRLPQPHRGHRRAGGLTGGHSQRQDGEGSPWLLVKLAHLISALVSHRPQNRGWVFPKGPHSPSMPGATLSCPLLLARFFTSYPLHLHMHLFLIHTQGCPRHDAGNQGLPQHSLCTSSLSCQSPQPCI